MGTISDKLIYLNGTKQAIKQAINEDFEVIDNNTTFRNYATGISNNNASYKALIPQNTVSGTNSVDISNSAGLDKALITEYGNTYQASSILPSGYTQVDYIQSTGSQYIDTGINADKNLRVEINTAFLNTTSANQTFGAIKIGTPNTRYHILLGGSLINIWLNDTSYSLASINGDKHYYDINPLGSYAKCDNTTITIPSNISDTGLSFWLFGRNSTGQTYLTAMKLWSCKMYYSGTLVRDFIPCYRNSDNVIGLYDIVNDTFYPNNSSSTIPFTYGSIVNIPNPDYPQEIVNINGKSTLKDVGKNLFDKNNANILNAYINGSTGIITADNNSRSIYISCKPNTTYTIQKILTTRFRVGYSNNTPIVGATLNGVVSNYDGTSITITTGNDTKYLVAWVCNIDTATLQEVLDSIQIEENSSTTTYEAYKEQSFDLDLKSKNLFDKNNANVLNAYFSSTQTTITSNSANRMIYIPVKPNTTYTMQKMNSAQFYLGYTNELPAENIEVFGITNTTTNIDDNHKYITITTGANAKYLVSRIYQTSQDTTITLQQILDSIQIEENSIATNYEPYYDINLCKIGTYKDRIYPLNGKWYLEKKIGKVVLNGSEYWYNAGGNGPFGLEITDGLITISNDIPPLVYCDKFYPVSQSATWSVYDSLISTSRTDTSTKIIRIRYTSISGLENFKTWLSTHNTILYYVLATPTTTEITESNYPTLYNQLNNIKLFEGVNHITFTNESGLDVEFDIEYYKDWKLD